ncbi:hypothetical protein Mucpa_2751 [Mucilaginibacter paludis DSM 18603]|uniref:Uncharacterized protein n=1 Tax=Mucilaginibacter paludis DSM 18603 TaxID=714943 RepID=H1Y6S1_9SPHI|nr:hypothetical protein Mucpa_2751 [Mucilaginibacter paludis DSM 18603]
MLITLPGDINTFALEIDGNNKNDDHIGYSSIFDFYKKWIDLYKHALSL